MIRPGHRVERSNLTRPLAPILGETWLIRTLHPFDRRWGERDGSTALLDGIVQITLSVVSLGRDDIVVSRVVVL